LLRHLVSRPRPRRRRPVPRRAQRRRQRRPRHPPPGPLPPPRHFEEVTGSPTAAFEEAFKEGNALFKDLKQHNKLR
ncbi:MAG: hypothetical protein M3R38_35985, partial [Actinomycetota bacterium]|nr:hypothetical protein [Actinomycetota bacterium]